MHGFESSFSQEVFLETIQGHVLGGARGGEAWVWGEKGFAHIAEPQLGAPYLHLE